MSASPPPQEVAPAASSAAPASISSFRPLAPPSPSSHHPPALSKIARLQLNAREIRTEEENTRVDVKYRTLTYFFATLVVALPLVAALVNRRKQ